MTDRLKSVKRILAVQVQVKRMAEIELAATERRKGALDTARKDLVAFVETLHGAAGMGLVATRQGSRLAKRETDAEAARLKQAAALATIQARLKLAERVNEAVGREERAAGERRELERLIEVFAGRAIPRDW